jgi:DNA (cytosine-5)-methyltransferase 1
VRELSLFSGAGGGLLGTFLLGWTPIGYVEWDDYCQRVLAARIRDGYLPAAPIFGDVREFVESGAAREYRGFADVVTAGFPCQPFSVAGKRRGADDERNMWPATAEVLRVVRPRYALMENVPGLLAPSHGYFGTVLGDLAEMGFDARWGVLGADDAGAPHRRKRLWIVATDAERDELRDESGRRDRTSRAGSDEPRDDDATGHVADADCGRLDTQRQRLDAKGGRWQAMGTGGCGALAHASADGRDARRTSDRAQGARGREPSGGGGREAVADAERVRQLQPGRGEPDERGRASDGGSCRNLWWRSDPAEDPESGVGRVAHRLAARVDRLRAIGNGQVPAVVRLAWHLLIGEMS